MISFNGFWRDHHTIRLICCCFVRRLPAGSPKIHTVLSRLIAKVPVYRRHWDVIGSAIFIAALTGAALKGVEYWGQRPQLEKKINEIQNRPKVIVRSDAVHPAP
jgi:hypothetical protein